jgi:DNA-binding CsgD family transcriptional regulator
LYGRSRLSSLNGETGSVDDFGEPLILHDVLASQQEDPGTKAARVIDWQEFITGCSHKDKAIINCIIEGKPLASVARKRHLNTSTIIYHKRRLADAISSFFGPSIIIEVQRRPGWQDSINATRMKMACREGRRHL